MQIFGTVGMPLRGTTKDANLAASDALRAGRGRVTVAAAGDEVDVTVVLRA